MHVGWLDWYWQWRAKPTNKSVTDHPALAVVGIGQRSWAIPGSVLLTIDDEVGIMKEVRVKEKTDTVN